MFPTYFNKLEFLYAQVWQFSHISGWGVYQEQYKFKVTIKAEDLTEELFVDLADKMLKTLSWPKSYSVISRKEQRYLYITPLVCWDKKNLFIYFPLS